MKFWRIVTAGVPFHRNSRSDGPTGLVAGPGDGSTRPIDISIDNLDRIDVFLDDRPHASLDVGPGSTSVDVPSTASRVRLRGWSDGSLVTSTDLDLT
ncbi:hypothetical protein [Ilumatobacter nonamiensis]|uniref:hypothetical protein n=1 Tax=Ilumatobacter nonamiensis TaxID=467093 RepID=UPI0003456D65|nr:hypothetical protein [Ilumatobacter nonamiensis]